MEKIYINGKLTNAERETILSYDCEDRTWHMDTTIMKDYNKAIKQGWKQTMEYRYKDGDICGGRFEAPYRAVTIRNIEKRKMSKC